jgi:NitT/TauT family transport system ATP-binding protein
MNVSDPRPTRPDDEIASGHAVSDGGAGSEAAPVVVDVQGVEKVFDTDRGRLTALSGIDLSIREGEFISLIGPSGCGKSTLLRLIGDLTSPSTGTILVNGKAARAARLGREYGMVFQAPVLMDWRTVQRNVELPLEIMGYSRAERERKARAMLELVELADFDRVHPWQLSGGMQQRVAIARALAFDPKLLLMDEPFGALDEMTRERMNLELMNIWRRTGITIIFVTHSIPEAVFLSSRVVVMSARPGRITRVVDVELPHPRTVDTRELERYFELVTSVREALRRHETDADAGSSDDGARIRAERLA